MTKYLMRAAASPFLNPGHREAIAGNLVHGNSGNLLFSHAVARALMRNDVQVDFTKTNRKLSDDEIAEIDREYDAFIIPLANAFRAGFIMELRIITSIVKKLSIPCIVIGVGAQVGLKGMKDEKREWDADVKRFCDAVLERSSIIGIRGESTAQYLELLGYRRERDFTIIGCPSLFLYGANLPVPRALSPSAQTKVSLNNKATLPKRAHLLLKDACKAFPDHYYIVQNDYELKTLYCGIDINATCHVAKTIHKRYPTDYSHALYRADRVRGFVSAQAWIDFLKTRELSLGTRIHGNIAAILAGTPAFIVAPDKRVLELADYHRIPHVALSDLERPTDFYGMLERADFSSVLEGHAERFEHYLDFLHRNDLKTVFDDHDAPSPFDERIGAIDFEGPVRPLPFAPYEGQLEAIGYWNEMLSERTGEIEALRAETQTPIKQASDHARQAAGNVLRKFGVIKIR